MKETQEKALNTHDQDKLLTIIGSLLYWAPINLPIILFMSCLFMELFGYPVTIINLKNPAPFLLISAFAGCLTMIPLGFAISKHKWLCQKCLKTGSPKSRKEVMQLSVVRPLKLTAYTGAMLLIYYIQYR